MIMELLRSLPQKQYAKTDPDSMMRYPVTMENTINTKDSRFYVMEGNTEYNVKIIQVGSDAKPQQSLTESILEHHSALQATSPKDLICQ